MTSWKYPALLAVALLLALVLIPGICAAATEQEMNNENVYGILSGPKSPTTFTFTQTVTLTHIGTYHYHDKNKVVPLGTLGLRDASGKIYGPWKTTGLEGQGGVKDAFWDAAPNAVIPAGTYTVVDSDPETWSYNKQSNYQGFASVRYIPAAPPVALRRFLGGSSVAHQDPILRGRLLKPSLLRLPRALLSVHSVLAVPCSARSWAGSPLFRLGVSSTPTASAGGRPPMTPGMTPGGVMIRTDPVQDPAGPKGMDRMLPMRVMAAGKEIPARDHPKAALNLTAAVRELAA